MHFAFNRIRFIFFSNVFGWIGLKSLANDAKVSATKINKLVEWCFKNLTELAQQMEVQVAVILVLFVIGQVIDQ